MTAPAIPTAEAQTGLAADLSFFATAAPTTAIPALPTAATLGIALRPARDADLEFLSSLYASTRYDELAATDWPDAAKQAFLLHQFTAQHRHYQAHYHGAVWLVVERHGAPVGRLYLTESAEEIRIVDMALLPDASRHGIGGAILTDLARRSAAAGKPLSIHVEHSNPARRLYDRMGFVTIGDTGVHALMRRPPGA